MEAAGRGRSQELEASLRMADGAHAEDPPMSIVFLENQSYSNVTFPDVQKLYTPGVDLTCSYNLSKHIAHRPKDWVGIFKVGWTTPRDYFTFVWAPPSTAAQQEVLFKAYYLPKDEEEYYQFCYVDQDGSVRGASSPFRFHRETEDDMVVVPTLGELESLQEKNQKIQKENQDLKEKCELLVKEKKDVQALLKQSQGELESLQEKNQKIQKENQDLKEKCELLVKEKKDVQALLKQSQAMVKELEEQKVDLQNQNGELQRQNVGLQSQNKGLQCQNEDLQRQTADTAPASQLSAAKLELASAKKEIGQITGQKEELQKRVESLVGREETLELKLKAQKDETALIETERNHLREQNQKLKLEKIQMEDSLRKTLDRIAMLQTERADLKKEMEKICEESEAKTKDVQNLTTEKVQMQQTILAEKMRLRDLEDHLREERRNIDEMQQNLSRQMILREGPINPLRNSPADSFVEVDRQDPENSGLIYRNPYGSMSGTPSAAAKTKECPFCEKEFEEVLLGAHIQQEHSFKCEFCSATYSVLEKQVYEDHVFCHTMENEF